jgi:hypothetical protein
MLIAARWDGMTDYVKTATKRDAAEKDAADKTAASQVRSLRNTCQCQDP